MIYRFKIYRNMSFSIYLGQEDLNVTWNVSELLSKAFDVDHWSEFINGKNGLFLQTHFERALHRLKKNPEKYKQYEASNGWGTVDQMISYLERWVHACKNYPEDNVTVWCKI